MFPAVLIAGVVSGQGRGSQGWQTPGSAGAAPAGHTGAGAARPGAALPLRGDGSAGGAARSPARPEHELLHEPPCSASRPSQRCSGRGPIYQPRALVLKKKAETVEGAVMVIC